MALDKICYRLAVPSDIILITQFVDYWLSGRGQKEKAIGAVNDYFVSNKQHKDYLRKFTVLLALDDSTIVGWAVKTKPNTLIHLLIAGNYRGQGIGREMVRIMAPDFIRSKVDQSTGNPKRFYTKLGFSTTEGPLVGKNNNIELLARSGRPTL